MVRYGTKPRRLDLHRHLHTVGPMAAASVLSRQVRGLVRTMRPKQWIKNVLVAGAPFAGGVGLTGAVPTLGAFAAFTLVASGAYCVNDAVDAERDRHHPRKQHRPVAAGVVARPVAAGVGVVAVVVGVYVAWRVNQTLAGVVLAYATHTFLYSFVLKHIASVELVALAAGFVLRLIGGAAATEIRISGWFFVCVAGGALLMASGKRTAELAHGASTRAVLASYTASFLDTVRAAAVAVTLTSYALWTLDGPVGQQLTTQVSLLPLTAAVLRYAQVASSGAAGEPEEIVLHDRVLQACGAVWAVLLAAAVYG